MNKYIGLQSYTESDAERFKGRESEIADLLNLVRHSDIVVLYSESAEGKSSLLNAGLFPRFRQMAYLPVNIVFTDTDFSNPAPDFDRIVIDRITDAIKNADYLSTGVHSDINAPSFSVKTNESEHFQWVSTSDVEAGDNTPTAKSLTGSVWWLLRNFALERFAARYGFVLVFDQFEEVFTQPTQEWTDSFFKWLEEINSNNCPESICAVLERLSESDDGILPDYNSHRSFKEIISMRNEYMGDLDYWGVQRHFMPELKNSRYCLKPLTIDEANRVLDLGFNDDADLKRQIIAAVSGIETDRLPETDHSLPKVQAMLLSVVCSALSENDHNRMYLQALEKGDSGVISAIIYDVYRSIGKKCGVSDSSLKKIETMLIDESGKRVRTKLSGIVAQDRKSGEKVYRLKRNGIIKSSRINGDEYVELVHDQLAKSIFNRREKNKKNHRRAISFISVVTVCVLVLFAWLSSVMTFDPDKSYPAKVVNIHALAEPVENDVIETVMIESTNVRGNHNVEILKLKNMIYDVIVDNCVMLDSVYILRNDSSVVNPYNHEPTIRFGPLPSLRKIIVADSVKGLTLDIYDNVGFCAVELGKGSDVTIKPRSETTVVKSNSDRIIEENGRWWNLDSGKIIFMPYTLSREQYFDFPDSINSKDVKYGWQTYHNTSSYHSPIDPMEFIEFGNHKIYEFNAKSYRGKLDLNLLSEVHEIKYNAFRSSNMDSIILPPDLLEIESSAFEDCPNLKTVTIPSSVTTISPYAFDDQCEVIFEDKSLNNPVIVKDSVITGVSFPQKRGIYDLNGMPDTYKIKSSAFLKSRMDSVILPQNLKEIESYAFRGCPNLKSVVIPSSVIKIADNAFDDNCEVLFENESAENIITLNDSVLTGISLPQKRGIVDLSGYTNVSTIGHRAFCNCRMDSVILPPNLKNIRLEAFSNCQNLKSISIPATVKHVYLESFDDSCDIILESNSTRLNSINEIKSFKYRGTELALYSLKVLDGPEDLNIIIHQFAQNIDSVLRFDENFDLGKVRSIHLALPRPSVWVMNDSLNRRAQFSIDMPDSIKQNVVLYVPHGSKKYYDKSYDFKAFREIREDSRMRRYLDIAYFRFGGVIPWFTAPYNALITLLGIAIVFIFFYYTCKVNYRRTSPYLATWKVHLLSALNGLGMVIVATLGFMAVYWWMWDLSDQSFLLTACCGIVGALLALSLCY